MPPKQASAAAPAATRPSRARAAKTSTKEAVAKLAASARSTLRKLSPSSSKSTSSKSTVSKKSTTAPSTSSRSTARTSTSTSNTSVSKTSKAATKKAAAAAPPARKIARATGASKKTKPSTQAESNKRANIGKKRSLKNEEETDDEDEPKAKKAKTPAVTKAKPKTAAAKLLATKAKMGLKKAEPARAKATTNPKKRKAEDEDEEEIAPASKKAKKENTPDAPKKRVAAKKAAPKKTAAPKPVVDPISKIKILVQINFAPTNPLDIFVFGEGSAGELGLGARRINGKSPIDIKRPRKNVLLSAPTVGVVQLACGGMHGIALTKDNKVLTWGVNDQGALGRVTQWNDEMRIAAGYESDDSDDSGLNPRESTPTEIDMTGVAPNTKFVQVAASDSASFAVTEDGRVYGWGTFRNGDGILGFSADIEQQRKPLLLTFVNKIVAVACGSNHVLALDHKGKVFTWGAPDQNQLGRRVVERDVKSSALRAGGMGFKRRTRIVKVACGSYHSFALDDQGRLWSWGLNNHGQLGHSAISGGDDDVCVLEPQLVECDQPIVDVAGGEHHSIIVTTEGKALVFGRIATSVLGLTPEAYTQDNCIYDSKGHPAICAVPSELPGPPNIVSAAIGTETSFVMTEEGHAYAWGSNCTFQCGSGTSDDIITPRRLDNSVVIDRKIIFAGAGGQYSMLAAVQLPPAQE